MAERKVYFCDWCEVQSPVPGSIGDSWVQLDVPGSSTREHLCQPCNNARISAICEARRARRPKATPAPGSALKEKDR